MQVRHSEQPNTDMLIYAFPVQGWYLISLPITVSNNNVKDLFPSAIGAFSFKYDIYEYVPITTMQTGEGYWLAVNEASMAMVTGTLIPEFTEHYTQGWHLLGSVIDSVDFSNPDDNPDNSVLLPLFAWYDIQQEYYATTFIEQAYGHWMAVIQECDVTVKNGSAPACSKSISQTEIQKFYQQYGSQPPPPPFVLQPELKELLPKKYQISYNYPNPFNSSTIIHYSLAQDSRVEIAVFNMLGQNIRNLFTGEISTGANQIPWDGRNDLGLQVASGVYVYKIVTESFVEMRKMVLLR